MSAPTVLVTGANGFVGRAVVERLIRDGADVRGTVRGPRCNTPPGARLFGDLHLDSVSEWSAALDGVGVIVHCAARAHVRRESVSDPLAEFRRVNVQGTKSLALKAVASGVRRLVFVSSIGVNGAETLDRAYQADDAPAPQSAYARSKLEGEIALKNVAAATGLEVVIVRPPLVYGPNAPGNFGALLRAVYRGLPLPLGAVDNRRSLVALDNLADLLALSTWHPAASGQTLLVSDDQDISTPLLVRKIALALGCRTRLLRVPVPLVCWVAQLMGRAGTARSLCTSLQVDITKTRQLLGWIPIIGVEEMLAHTAKQYLQDVERRRADLL